MTPHYEVFSLVECTKFSSEFSSEEEDTCMCVTQARIQSLVLSSSELSLVPSLRSCPHDDGDDDLLSHDLSRDLDRDLS